MDLGFGEEVGQSMDPHSEEIYTGIAGRACEACNKKKTKCDRQQPACGLCQRTGHECVFPSSRKRPSRQDPATRAKMQKIDSNIDRLLEILEANSESDTNDPKVHHIPAPNSQSTGRYNGHEAKLGNVFNTTLTPSHTPPPSTHHSPPAASRRPHGTSDTPSLYTSHELATHLIATYFDKIQPWIGVFHKPTFSKWCELVLSTGHNALDGLDSYERALFNAIFALAARFSNHEQLIGCHPRDRGAIFGRRAEQCLKEADDPDNWPTTCLQAYILTSIYQYCAGYSQKGWKTALTCIQACYDTHLYEIDDDVEDEADGVDDGNARWIHQEQQRRLFWAIWEVDLFGSILKRRPLGIDRRHVRVKLPVSDDAWFAGTKVESGLYLHGPEGWRSLSKSPNQEARAWMLLSKSFIGWLTDLALLKDGVTAEQKASVENNLGCFKLAMPESFHLWSPAWIDAHLSMVEQNYAVAINIYLSACAFVVAQFPVSDDHSVRTHEEHDRQQMSTYRLHAMDLNNIMRKWPPEAVQYAPPTVACALLTYNESLCKLLPLQDVEIAYNHLSELIISKFAERWTIGAILLQVREIAHNSRRQAHGKGADLVKEYPIYFNKFVRWKEDSKRCRSSTAEHNNNSSSSIGHKKNCIEENPEKTGLKSPSESSTSQYATPPMPVTQYGTATDPTSTSGLPVSGPTGTNGTISSIPDTSDIASVIELSHHQEQPHPKPMSHSSGSYFNLGTNNNNNSNQIINDSNGNIDMINPLTIPGFSSVSTLDGTPPDIDDLFSGFLQEPLWQDFQSGTFLV